MPKTFIDSDEWYPVYSHNESYGTEIEVSQETLDRWNATMLAFNAMQREMRELDEAKLREQGIIK